MSKPTASDYIQLDTIEGEAEDESNSKVNGATATDASPQPLAPTGASSVEHGSTSTGDEVRALLVQSQLPLLMSVAGLVLAGSLLDIVQHWDVFERISELFVLVPVLLNLKGNLEMNLGARLSTAANLGQLDRTEDRNPLLAGNLALLFLQALIVGCIAGFFSFILGLLMHPHPNNYHESMLMISGAMLCAMLSSMLIGTFMCALVVMSRFLNVDPDNIASPLASSLGDLITLLILAASSQLMLHVMGSFLTTGLFVGLVVMIPLCGWVAARNKKYIGALSEAGWIPILAAMLISSGAGLVLERFIAKYMGMALLSPVFNGIAGNLGSIYTSRLSTQLHLGEQARSPHIELALFCLNLPIQILFLLAVWGLNLGHVPFSWGFVLGYLLASLGLAWATLVLSRWMTAKCWQLGYNPDNVVLPYLTAVVDVLGTVTLCGVFWTLGLFGYPF
ncbi:uncharacterized protein VTP21DRAFT_9735 [Calcarisporiella thermophila]|uniref:uncharacterized protein n=1 Tax=Calcarisporiella thermophila TaxID=911321 RepID=UPI003742A91E